MNGIKFIMWRAVRNCSHARVLLVEVLIRAMQEADIPKTDWSTFDYGNIRWGNIDPAQEMRGYVKLYDRKFHFSETSLDQACFAIFEEEIEG